MVRPENVKYNDTMRILKRVRVIHGRLIELRGLAIVTESKYLSAILWLVETLDRSFDILEHIISQDAEKYLKNKYKKSKKK